ncbi:hypothetical protein AQUCO_00400447v1 [Aquilegia coerulea]|uniref:EF-hand domain-containing protein n=1 Tax=Aquilegia coerulea TaxID=218851 RepID=A0A2G5EUY1_AQUCA|nr:hypothetical protein AQUCO_00400447v1 [Aquilegia coerulea]
METRTKQIKSILEWYDQNRDGVLNREKLLSLVITVNPELESSTDDEQINGILDEVCKTRSEFIDIDDKHVETDSREAVVSVNVTCLSEEQQLKKNLWEKLRQEFWSKITWRKKLDKIKSSSFVSGDDDHNAEMPIKKQKWALLRYEFCAKLTWRKKLDEIKKLPLPHYLEKLGKQ